MMRKAISFLPDLRRLLVLGSLLCLAAVLTTRPARAQELDPAELEDLVAPVALYPDDVLGIILPASTFPLDIVRAARFLDDLEVDPSLEPDEAWDDSIVALLNYPEVVRMMNEDLDWTWALGEAVLTDQPAVLAAAQAFRSRAYASGNLRSDDKQVVDYSDGAIEIKPANPEVVYIPVYEPREVIVYHPAPIYGYYPIGYPVYYYPYPVGYSFGINYFWGVTSYFSVGWSSHYVQVLHHSDRIHPYYLNSYYLYTPYYPRSNVNITVSVDNYSNIWVPNPRRGSRPRTETVERRTSSVRPSTRTTESQPNVATSTRARPTGGNGQSISSVRARETVSGSPASDAGSVARSTTGRAESPRPESTRSVSSTARTDAQTGSIRTRNAASATTSTSTSTRSSGSFTSPSTRSPAISQPTTRPQVSAPAAPPPSVSSSRSTMSSQGTTRRAGPPSQPTRNVSPPSSSNGAAIGGVRQQPSRSDSGSRTRQP